MKTDTITTDENLIAYCGLYCGACKAYLTGRCPGCRERVKATWCKVRTCCRTHNFETCADCAMFTDPRRCVRFNNFFSRLFGLVFRSNRAACIDRIRAVGREAYATEMAAAKRHSLPG